MTRAAGEVTAYRAQDRDDPGGECRLKREADGRVLACTKPRPKGSSYPRSLQQYAPEALGKLWILAAMNLILIRRYRLGKLHRCLPHANRHRSCRRPPINCR